MKTLIPAVRNVVSVDSKIVAVGEYMIASGRSLLLLVETLYPVVLNIQQVVKHCYY